MYAPTEEFAFHSLQVVAERDEVKSEEPRATPDRREGRRTLRVQEPTAVELL